MNYSYSPKELKVLESFDFMLKKAKINFLEIRKLLYLLIIYVLYAPAAILVGLARIKFPNFKIDRIGHLIVESESYIKDHYLNQIKLPKTVLLAPLDKVANNHVLNYLKDYFLVVSDPFKVRLFQPLTLHPFSRFDVYQYVTAINTSAKCTTIETKWSDRQPLFKLKALDIERGQEALIKLGIPSDSWFVCIHCREGGYSPTDENIHRFRSADVETYSLAVDYIIDQGGYCIRMGDSSMSPIESREKYIDYAHSSEKSDWLDLYLSASCLFFLGSCSGAYNMSTMFGVPVACANMAPLASCFPYSKRDIGIPKLYRNISTGELISFKEILGSELGNFRFTSQFKESGIELLDSSPEDILELAIEQFHKVSGSYRIDANDIKRQAQFKALFRPGHYLYGSPSEIGTSFLRKYSFLL